MEVSIPTHQVHGLLITAKDIIRNHKDQTGASELTLRTPVGRGSKCRCDED